MNLFNTKQSLLVALSLSLSFLSLSSLSTEQTPSYASPLFSNPNWASTSISNSMPSKVTFSAAILQQDGKVTSIGYMNNISDNDFVLTRILANGSPDPHFGNNGQVVTPIYYGTNDVGYHLIEQEDEKLLVSGTYKKDGQQRTIILRYMPNGDIDKSFGSDGIVKTHLKWPGSMILQTDGKIVITGITGTEGNTITMLRFLENGDSDTNFAYHGVQNHQIEEHHLISSIIQKQDGKLVVACSYQLIDKVQTILSQFQSNGMADYSFGKMGTTYLPMSLYKMSKPLIQQSDEKLLIVNRQGSIYRLNTDGSLDNSFGQQGRLYLSNDLGMTYNAINLSKDGHILLAGSLDYNLAIMKFKPNGAIDISFGENGVTKVPDINITFLPYISLLQTSSEKLMVIGTGEISDIGYAPTEVTSYIPHILFGQFNNDGSLDTNFGEQGIVQTVVKGDNYDIATIMHQESDGKLLLAGTDFVRINSDAKLEFDFEETNQQATHLPRAIVQQDDDKLIFATENQLIRYTHDGKRDTSFGEQGFVNLNHSNDVNWQMDYLHGMIQLENGDIIIAQNTATPEITLSSYSINGEVNTHFIVHTDLTFEGSYLSLTASSLTEVADNKFLLAGYRISKPPEDIDVTQSIAPPTLVLLRYNSNGTLDEEFGIKELHQDHQDYSTPPLAIFIQEDEKIIIAASSNNSTLLLRVNQDGNLDLEFGEQGLSRSNNKMNVDYTLNIKQQDDQKLIIAGSSDDSFIIARYNTDGSLDSNYNNGGIRKIYNGNNPSLARGGLVIDGSTAYLGGTSNHNFAIMAVNLNEIDEVSQNQKSGSTHFHLLIFILAVFLVRRTKYNNSFMG